MLLRWILLLALLALFSWFFLFFRMNVAVGSIGFIFLIFFCFLGWMLLLALLAFSPTFFLAFQDECCCFFNLIFLLQDECCCWLCWRPELCVFCSTGKHYSYNHRGRLFHWIVTKQTMVFLKWFSRPLSKVILLMQYFSNRVNCICPEKLTVEYALTSS